MSAILSRGFLAVFLALIPGWQSSGNGQEKSRWEKFISEGEKHLAIDKKQAAKYFQVASEFAARDNRADGVLRAGFGLLAAGQPEAAEMALSSGLSARDISWKKKDWQGVLRAGDFLLHLEQGKEAAETLRMARDLAAELDKGMAVILAARGLVVLKSESEAREFADEAGEIFKETGSGKGLYRTAQFFSKLDDSKSGEYFDLAEQIGREDEGIKSYPRYSTDTLFVQGWGKIEPGLASDFEVESSQEDAETTTLKLRITDQQSIGGDQLTAAHVVASIHEDFEPWKRIGVLQVAAQEDTVLFELEGTVNPDYFRFALTDPTLGIRCLSPDSTDGGD